MNRRNRNTMLVGLLVLVTVFVGFVQAKIAVAGGGASSVDLLFKQYALTFQSLKPELAMSYTPVGSVGGAGELINGTLVWVGSDIQFDDRAASVSELRGL